MHPSRFIHMFPKQRDLMGFDEVGTPLQVFCCNLSVTNVNHDLSQHKGHKAVALFAAFKDERLWCTDVNNLPCHRAPLQIFLINLRRRPDRRDRMLFSLNELEIDVKVVDAVDGK